MPLQEKKIQTNFQIVDDFLSPRQFRKFEKIMIGKEFSWFYIPTIDYQTDINKFQFCHYFYDHHFCTSEKFDILNPILKIINPIIITLFRIKANLLTKTSKIVENEFHIDIDGIPEEKLKQFTTSIFYVNTNNGWTEFEDGTKVESVANRMVTFPANLKHRGTSCTDENLRVVINFNYFQ